MPYSSLLHRAMIYLDLQLSIWLLCEKRFLTLLSVAFVSVFSGSAPFPRKGCRLCGMEADRGFRIYPEFRDVGI